MLAPVSRSSRTFDGLTSRWTSPRACAASSASATCDAIASARPARAARRSGGAPRGRPLDEAHRDEQPVVDLPRLVDGNDVRVVEGRGDPRLAEEPLAKDLVLGIPLGEQLQRDAALEPRIAGAVDLAHAAAPDEPPRPPRPRPWRPPPPPPRAPPPPPPPPPRRVRPNHALRSQRRRPGLRVTRPPFPPATRASGARGNTCTRSPGRHASGSRLSLRRSRASRP